MDHVPLLIMAAVDSLHVLSGFNERQVAIRPQNRLPGHWCAPVQSPLSQGPVAPRKVTEKSQTLPTCGGVPMPMTPVGATPLLTWAMKSCRPASRCSPGSRTGRLQLVGRDSESEQPLSM